MQTALSLLFDTVIPLLAWVFLALGIMLVYVRAIGLRSFSKMTSFDFVTTVAIGSLLANAAIAQDWMMYLQSIIAIGALLLAQMVLATLRVKSSIFRSLIANKPIVLFRKGQFDESALSQTRVAKEDVWAKIREANALRMEDVHAVVLETTGDISVLHGKECDPAVMTGVRDQR